MKGILSWLETKAAIYIVVAVAAYIAYLQIQVNNSKRDLETQRIVFEAAVAKNNREQVDVFTGILKIGIDNMRNTVTRTDSMLLEKLKDYSPEKTKEVNKSYSTWQQRFRQSQ